MARLTPIADMVAVLLSAGVSAEMVVLAVRTAELVSDIRHETSVDPQAERRRAADRERKRNSTGKSAEAGNDVPDNTPKPSAEIPVETPPSHPRKLRRTVEIIEEIPQNLQDTILLKKEVQQVEEVVVAGPKGSKLKYPAAFEGWWAAYPKTPAMSKKEALAAWRKLSEEDRAAAVFALPGWREFVGKQRPDYVTLHACRFLSQRRFEGFAPQAPQNSAETTFSDRVYAKFCSPELDAWNDYGRKTKGLNYPQDRDGGWWFPTRWPPGWEDGDGDGGLAGAEQRQEEPQAATGRGEENLEGQAGAEPAGTEGGADDGEAFGGGSAGENGEPEPTASIRASRGFTI